MKVKLKVTRYRIVFRFRWAKPNPVKIAQRKVRAMSEEERRDLEEILRTAVETAHMKGGT